ncbi:hypothetical protein [uncultured Pseudokineococcus sp.]|uniref:hypothetical protein n=1 Tax=uncultured Pseudokineococcus sp. TaxID=1642928 RepID=UPI0026272796|nr:hypothetical protein [uncultured Pseudokineococcus sp.]
MTTLYLRNVPDEVVDRLRRLAEREATSVNAVALRELASSTRRVDNPALLHDLPDLGVRPSDSVDALDAAREGR